MNKNILTKVIPTSLVVAAAFSLMGCTVTKTQTYTETHTDANGNTTTYSSTTVSDENGTTTTTESYSSSEDEAEPEYTVATLHIDNESGWNFTEMYFTTADATEWGPEILGDDAPLADGEVITYPDALQYVDGEDGAYWSLLAVCEDGDQLSYDTIDIREASNPEDITIVIGYDAASDLYTCVVE